MKIVNYKDIEPAKTAPGVGAMPPGVAMRPVFGEKDGASIAMRVVEDEPSNELPHGIHSHPWEHYVYVIDGRGIIITEKEEVEVGRGDCVFIPASEPHTIGPRAGSEPFLFIDCITKS